MNIELAMWTKIGYERRGVSEKESRRVKISSAEMASQVGNLLYILYVYHNGTQ
ncbi:hypothetical protein [Portibacter lacus]|uniref:Uncharacterized protein n=1 Tax=Portibacter lacus TaxID=1099794 RepID=A0AA37WFV4_9BACT|nr:hypothetical protein [Portibacter lacus]GLR19032.1 hypothetical protein GCM10007940_36480 [Portibacter lacus]